MNGPKSDFLVSVIITTYNRFDQFKRAGKSVLSQTYENIEIIIVEDGSSSEIETWLKDNKYGAVKYVCNDKNMGLAYSRNVGLRMASGEFIFYLDDDDEWYPDRVEKQMRFYDNISESDKDRLGIMYCGAEIRFPGKNAVSIKHPKHRGPLKGSIINRGIDTIASSYVFIKQALEDVGGFDESLISCIDHDIWMKLANCGYKVAALDEPLVIVYDRTNRDTMMTRTDYRIKGVRTFAIKWRPIFCEWFGEKKGYQFSKRYFSRVISRLAANKIVVGNFGEANRAIKAIFNFNHNYLYNISVIIWYTVLAGIEISWPKIFIDLIRGVKNRNMYALRERLPVHMPVISEKDRFIVGEKPARVMQVNISDAGGGSAKIAWAIHDYLNKTGCEKWFVVGYKKNKRKDVVRIFGNSLGEIWPNMWLLFGRAVRKNWGNIPLPLLKLSCIFGNLFNRDKDYYGFEDFNFPSSWKLLDLLPEKPDLVHCHCLHGGFFNLAALPYLSNNRPFILTLHDAWMLSGHCAHSMGCERWRIGCGDCPDLLIYPAVWKDVTAQRWREKKDIYLKSKLYIATPSQWLMDKVKASMMTSGMVESKVINNGVDLMVFSPRDKYDAREKLDLTHDAKVLLFIGNGIRKNAFKDYATLQKAAIRVAEKNNNEKIIFLVLGERGPLERHNNLEIRFESFKNDPEQVADYYNASDLYIHAAKADTFPNTVIEALACGIPVVASAVGGIPEQVKGFRGEGKTAGEEFNLYSKEDATGILVPKGDPDSMSEAIFKLLNDRDLYETLSENASKDARVRFDMNKQCQRYLDWYKEILATWR